MRIRSFWKSGPVRATPRAGRRHSLAVEIACATGQLALLRADVIHLNYRDTEEVSGLSVKLITMGDRIGCLSRLLAAAPDPDLARKLHRLAVGTSAVARVAEIHLCSAAEQHDAAARAAAEETLTAAVVTRNVASDVATVHRAN